MGQGFLCGLSYCSFHQHIWSIQERKVQYPTYTGEAKTCSGQCKAEHWKLFFQAEVKSPELCCTATVLGWQYFLTVLFVNVPEDLWVCIKGCSIWVLKHQHSIEQDVSGKMNLCQICAVFFDAHPSTHILLTSHELKVIPMCIPLHYNLPHVNISKICLSICVSVFHMGRQVAWGSSSKGWEKYSGKQHHLDIEG